MGRARWPGPMAGMMLSDMGAEVTLIENPDRENPRNISFRGKSSITLNLKRPKGINVLHDLIKVSDVLIDPYRPGVCERLGIGPNRCSELQPSLVFARITGWGQTGPLARHAGHDINYISIAGVLHCIGKSGDTPTIPLNLVGDMGGGGMLLVNGILAALLERHQSGMGQVVDAAMVDVAAQQMWMVHSMVSDTQWRPKQPGSNMLDGGSHYYNVYRCADDKFISVGAIEPKFYQQLLSILGQQHNGDLVSQDFSAWNKNKQALSDIFQQHSRDYWCKLFENTDACVSPVLDITETPSYPANVERQLYQTVDDTLQPSPAPRFDRTPSKIDHGPVKQGQDTESILSSLGYSRDQILQLYKEKITE